MGGNLATITQLSLDRHCGLRLRYLGERDGGAPVSDVLRTRNLYPDIPVDTSPWVPSRRVGFGTQTHRYDIGSVAKMQSGGQIEAETI